MESITELQQQLNNILLLRKLCFKNQMKNETVINKTNRAGIQPQTDDFCSIKYFNHF